MILGIGADIVEIKHFNSVLKKTPAVVQRVFTPKERQIADKLSVSRKSAYYAKRFAAKEAVSKACGTGIGDKINWQDFEILNNMEGMPLATISSETLSFLQKKFKTKKIQIQLSLSDEKEYVLAFAVLQN